MSIHVYACLSSGSSIPSLLKHRMHQLSKKTPLDSAHSLDVLVHFQAQCSSKSKSGSFKHKPTPCFWTVNWFKCSCWKFNVVGKLYHKVAGDHWSWIIWSRVNNRRGFIWFHQFSRDQMPINAAQFAQRLFPTCLLVETDQQRELPPCRTHSCRYSILA